MREVSPAPPSLPMQGSAGLPPTSAARSRRGTSSARPGSAAASAGRSSRSPPASPRAGDASFAAAAPAGGGLMAPDAAHHLALERLQADHTAQLHALHAQVGEGRETKR